MKRYYYLVFFLLILFSSCKKKITPVNNEDAHELFNQTSSLLVEFTDKIQLAQDSASVDSLKQLVEKHLVDINFSVRPETDYKITEEENDSLFRLMNQYRNISQEKLRSISQNNTLEEELPDSINN